MRFTVGTTAEGKPAVYLGGAFVRHAWTGGDAATLADEMNNALTTLLRCGIIRAELACIFLNAGEGWNGKQPETVQYSGTFDVHEIAVDGEVDESGDAALTWTPAVLNAIGGQLREQLGESFRNTEDFGEVRRQEGL